MNNCNDRAASQPGYRSRLLTNLILILSAFLGSAFTHGMGAASAAEAPPGPDRFTVVTVAYTAYEWWLVRWQENQVVCSIVVDHEEMPTPSEVYRDCGQTIYAAWISQKPCITDLEGKTCEGYYVHLSGSRPAQKEVTTPLAPASAWISLEGCEPLVGASTTICESAPAIVIQGQEPLPTEKIIRLEGTYNGKPFFCDGSDTCKFVPQETGLEGVSVEFWAHSSYGDSSPLFRAQVRVSRVHADKPDPSYWYIDVLSSQWLGQPVAVCAEWWGALPPVGGPPDWLTSPTKREDLRSNVPYNHLASNLIEHGMGSAIACSNGGLEPGGGVNACGLESARAAVTEWQNRFDGIILKTSQETGVPARLMKNLFARESQFWPGHNPAWGEMGLGHLTEQGSDTTFAWNSSFYEQFCPSILSEERCSKGYAHLGENERLLLRQSLVASVNATCADCPLGYDVSKSDFSVNVFAQTLIANCRQTGQVVGNYTGSRPGASVSYEDLWKLTLVNYNAGPRCLGDAITGARLKGLPLIWENITSFLPAECARAIEYVNDISQ